METGKQPKERVVFNLKSWPLITFAYGLFLLLFTVTFHHYELVATHQIVQKTMEKQRKVDQQQIHLLRREVETLPTVYAKRLQTSEMVKQIQLNLAVIVTRYQLTHSVNEVRNALTRLNHFLTATQLPEFSRVQQHIQKELKRLSSYKEIDLNMILLHSSKVASWLHSQLAVVKKTKKPLKKWGVDWSQWISIRKINHHLPNTVTHMALESLSSLEWAAKVGDQQVYQLNAKQLRNLSHRYSFPQQIITFLDNLAVQQVAWQTIDFGKLNDILSHVSSSEGTVLTHKKSMGKPILSKKQEVPIRKLLRRFREQQPLNEVM